MKIEIGSYEAKTRLPELIRGVQEGKRYTITLRGKAVAELGPPESDAAGEAARVAAAVEAMQRFIANRPRIRVDIKALIEDGRD